MKVRSILSTFVIWCLVCLPIASAQDQQKIDSLLIELQRSKPDTNKAVILFKLTWEQMKGGTTKVAHKR